MGIEKQGSKGGGGYVGGFLQLFDWNGKSRKKLFSNKSDFPEGSQQGKRSEGNLPMTRLHPNDDDLYGRSSVKERSDYSCSSSVTDDEGNGTRAPGVVARLMGLDCLPTSDTVEPYCSPLYDSRSLRDSHHRRTPEIPYGNQIMHSGYLPTELEGFSGKPFEMRPQKKLNRPIERFQTEILPPRSAKSIPITHHKLLSPIKNPGFIPTKDAAQIMEEAAKIIERGYQASNKGKMPPLGSSSVPLKIRDLKEKMEATQRPTKLLEASRRPIESNAVKYLKGQSLNKSWNGSDEAPQFRNSPYTDESNSAGSKSKGKSVSLAIQAKVNVQRREGLSSTGSRSLGQKERHEFKSNKSFKSQMNTQKNMQKKPSSDRASGVLRQNNQKQNCQTNREKLPSKPSVPKQQGRKSLSVDASFGRNKVSNKVTGTSKVGSRRTGLDTGDLEKDAQLSNTKNFPRKKRSIERDFHSEKSAFSGTILVDKDQMAIQSNVALDGQLKWVDDNRGKGMDVVSFTFTSPLIKSFPGSQSSGQVVERNISFCEDSTKEKSPTGTKNARLPFPGLNVIGGDALSILLEQKIRELTFGVESSSRNSIKSQSGATSASCLQDLVPGLNAASKMSREDCNISQLGSLTDEFGSQCESNCSSTDWHKLQGVEEIGKCSSSSSSSTNSETRKELDFPHTSPVSTLESSFSNESCISSDSWDSYNMNGGKQCSSVEAAQGVNSNCRKRLPSVEAETELSDSASFPFNGSASSKHTMTFGITDYTRSDEWELEYVREVLCNAELMFKDFTLGRAREIINPHLFDQLENRKSWSRSFHEEEKDCRLRRKMLFDCVGECLDLRCRRYVGGGSGKWEKGLAMVSRKDRLADEVYKEITGWRSMGDWMLDEVVDKDMSTQYGRWLEFEIEEFEIGLCKAVSFLIQMSPTFLFLPRKKEESQTGATIGTSVTERTFLDPTTSYCLVVIWLAGAMEKKDEEKQMILLGKVEI
ncbi:protein of unknown function DUF4378 [Macleaya cordata]|uniref:DUF4378 domain-containing protein n=1 Tax=Macleaya cordata TaxID=56857 RepID=A0A200R275_MACCD|nr:protein of unknown function DUF4378 [Macleaya cordata]